MRESLFEIEMVKADVMGMVEMAEYWEGYKKGIGHRFHGEGFCSPEEHDALMVAVDTDTEDQKERVRGYRDGYLGVVDLGDPANGIATLRKWRGWSVEDLAEKAGVSPQTVAAWEVGKLLTEPELQIMEKLRSE